MLAATAASAAQRRRARSQDGRPAAATAADVASSLRGRPRADAPRNAKQRRLLAGSASAAAPAAGAAPVAPAPAAAAAAAGAVIDPEGAAAWTLADITRAMRQFLGRSTGPTEAELEAALARVAAEEPNHQDPAVIAAGSGDRKQHDVLRGNLSLVERALDNERASRPFVARVPGDGVTAERVAREAQLVEEAKLQILQQPDAVGGGGGGGAVPPVVPEQPLRDYRGQAQLLYTALVLLRSRINGGQPLYTPERLKAFSESAELQAPSVKNGTDYEKVFRVVLLYGVFAGNIESAFFTVCNRIRDVRQQARRSFIPFWSLLEGTHLNNFVAWVAAVHLQNRQSANSWETRWEGAVATAELTRQAQLYFSTWEPPRATGARSRLNDD